MTTTQLFASSLPYVLVVVVLMFAVVLLAPGDEEVRPDESRAGWRMIAVLAIFCAMGRLAQTCLIYIWSRPENLAILGRNLFSGRQGKERAAINFMSLVAGRRFGHPGHLGRSKKHVRCLGMWQQWWERNKDCLSWDSELRVYMNHKLSEFNKR